MATNRLPQRRTLSQRGVKADENAMSRHLRQPSNVTAARFAAKENAVKTTATRQALGEVTFAAVNRKDPVSKTAAGKEKEEIGLKRGRSNSTTLAQRVPLGPGRTQPAPPVVSSAITRVVAPIHVVRAPAATAHKRTSRPAAVERVVREEIDERIDDVEVGMDVEEDMAAAQQDLEDDVNLLVNEQEVEAMIGVDDSEDEELEVTEIAKVPEPKAPRVWPEVSTDRKLKYETEVHAIRAAFEDEVDMYDTTMVSEYAEEIFEYMGDLEEDVMPDANYMDGQNEITWQMRQTLVDWLLQVHLRYHMLPETLWIAVNIVDRFLTKRVVSLVKLQLVGVTAMFVAAKYEEILAPSVDEFVFMTENGYTKEEILKGERIMLQTLEFRVSHYCSPYSWMRKISKADDYDIQTRTLSKFLTEVTLLDHQFLRVKPSLVAAVGMYTARRMLGGDWNDAFVFFSGYTEEQLMPGHDLLVSKLVEDNFSRQYVCKKYANKKFLKASVFAIDWARTHSGNGEKMMLEE